MWKKYNEFQWDDSEYHTEFNDKRRTLKDGREANFTAIFHFTNASTNTCH